MIRTENLRSAFTKDDVDEYLYKLLPGRDAVVREMEDYAAEHGVPIIGPAVARLLSLLVQVSGAKRIFEMGLRLATPQSGWPAQRDRKARSFIRTEIRRRCAGHRCTSAWRAWPSESKSRLETRWR
jgi:hypothetical protein